MTRRLPPQAEPDSLPPQAGSDSLPRQAGTGGLPPQAEPGGLLTQVGPGGLLTQAVANGLLTQAGRVLPEWLDVNGHMNSAWYDVVFDRAESALFDAFGIDEDYTRRTGQGVFRLEKRLRYLRELLPDTPFRVQSRITMTDLRHIRHRHHLLHAETGAVMAVKEAHSLHVDLARRKAVPVAHPPVREALSRLAAEHADLPDPAP